MKNDRFLASWPAYALVMILILGALACGEKVIVAPVADQLKKVWTAQRVQENAAVVYTRGAANNVRSYTGFRLDLSTPPAVSFTDYDGVTISGQYDVPSDTRLVLKNLTPQPSGTGGTIEFTINAISTTDLTLTRTTANAKTGNSNNQYVLTNP